ncbi:MAG: hypothetical protein ABW223_08430 [Rariglobus sp.]
MRYPVLVLALLCFGSALHADVTLAPLFTDHAVLQRDKPVPIWGTASPGEKISVSFAGQTLPTTAAANKKRTEAVRATLTISVFMGILMGLTDMPTRTESSG